MFAIMFDSSSTSWELRNAILPMFFQCEEFERRLYKYVLPQFKDVCFYWLALNSNIYFIYIYTEIQTFNSVQTCQLHQ